MTWKLLLAGLVLVLYVYLIFAYGTSITAHAEKKIDDGKMVFVE